MSLYLYSNILGSFLFDSSGKLVDKTLFNKDYLDKFKKIREEDWLNEEKNLIGKHLKQGEEIFVVNGKKDIRQGKDGHIPGCKPAELVEPVIETILSFFSKKDHASELRKRNIEITKSDMRTLDVNDMLVIQSINSTDEIEHAINTIGKRMREWYEIYFPEASKKMKDNAAFSLLIASKSKDELMKELGIRSSFGTDLRKKDLQPIMKLAKQISSLSALKEDILSYLESLLGDYCPNLLALCGASVSGRLIALSGSLERLSSFPSSTVQTLGAEKALFRHLKTGNKPPKYGVILMHPLVSQAGRDKGKIARMLANKISLAAKVDFFRGDDYRGYELRDNIEKELKKLKR